MAKTSEQESRSVFKVEEKVELSEGISSFDEKFPIIRASTLSQKKSLVEHKPQSVKQEKLYDLICFDIQIGLKDFRRPTMDPSLDEDGTIVYKEGEKPAVFKQVKFWREELKKFMPEKNSRMGTIEQYGAFLGLLIDYLVEEKGYKVEDAWKAVCDDSKELGNYCDSNDSKHALETTGSRKVWNFYDLANTRKLLEGSRLGSDSDVRIVGGNYGDYGTTGCLISLGYEELKEDDFLYSTVGWLVTDV